MHPSVNPQVREDKEVDGHLQAVQTECELHFQDGLQGLPNDDWRREYVYAFMQRVPCQRISAQSRQHFHRGSQQNISRVGEQTIREASGDSVSVDSHP